MNRLYAFTYRSANYAADIPLFLAAFYAASSLVCQDSPLSFSGISFGACGAGTNLFLSIAFYGVNFFSLAYFGTYHSSRLRSFEQVAALYLKSVILGLLIVELIDSSYAYADAVWFQLPMATILSFVLLLLKEVILRNALRYARRNGSYVRKAVVVAQSRTWFEHLRQECENDPLTGLDIAEFFGGENLDVNASDLGSVLDAHGLGAVICLADEVSDTALGEILHACEERGVQIYLRFEILNRYLQRSALSTLGGENYLSLQGESPESAMLLVKNCFDRVMSFLLLIVLSPLFLLIGLCVAVGSKGPVVFRQERAGRDGRPFYCLKFRTMSPDAESRLEEVLHQNEMIGPIFKMKNDPRVNWVGKILRRTSLDELPQLWNVLRGEMSLVGPRPLPLREAERIQPWQRQRLRMRPGITGLWQVSGRSEITDFEELARMDLEYIHSWSFSKDLFILLKTAYVVLRGKGAV